MQENDYSAQKFSVAIATLKGGILKRAHFLFTLGMFNLDYQTLSNVKSKDSF